MKRYISLVLSFVMIVFLFVGCSTETPETTGNETTAATTQPEETIPETEPRLPMISDNKIELYYDDYFDLSQIAEDVTSVEVKNQTVTSKVVGSDNADEAVVIYHEEKNCLIATGVGEAVVAINDAEYSITVHVAPISLFMITGHSIGAGQTGVAEQSVLCEDGTAYSMHGAKNVEDYAPGTGIVGGLDDDGKLDGIQIFSCK